MGSYTYDKQSTRFIGLKFNNRTDADIIKMLESQANKQSYIKQLIRADIEANGIPQTEKREEE